MDALSANDAVLGAGLPPDVEALIAAAGRLRARPAEALSLLIEARRRLPEHPAPVIALYRFHFYGNRLVEARELAGEALLLAAAALGLPPAWQDVEADSRFLGFEAMPRFFLFALKGYAYLSLRLGELEEGAEALAKLALLDPKDRVGHRVLRKVLRRRGREDVEDYGEEESFLPALAVG